MRKDNNSKGFFEWVDQFIFIKRGYSPLKHLLPFSISALLLLILSIPTDNLFLKFVSLLQRPDWIWLPAGLLSIIALAVYFFSLLSQVRQAYLWPQGEIRRTVYTTVVYITITALMAFSVLCSASSSSCLPTYGDIWACFLISVLSLTGIGWSGPSKWVESIGINSPDYRDGRSSAKRLTTILQRVRSRNYTVTKEDVESFVGELDNLRSNIKKNMYVEPRWAQCKMGRVVCELSKLIAETIKEFRGDNHKVQNFQVACNCQQEALYGDFISVLKSLANYWREWECQA